MPRHVTLSDPGSNRIVDIRYFQVLTIGESKQGVINSKKYESYYLYFYTVTWNRNQTKGPFHTSHSCHLIHISLVN